MVTRAKPKTKVERAAMNLKAAIRVVNGEVLFPYSDDLPKEHQRIWKQTVNCKPINYFNPGDIPLLEIYCRNVYEWQELNVAIDRGGLTITTARGHPVVNPALVARGYVEAKIFALATKLRLQPASRLDSDNDKSQSAKAEKAGRAAKAMGGDGLLAGDGDDYGPGNRAPLDGLH